LLELSNVKNVTLNLQKGEAMSRHAPTTAEGHGGHAEGRLD